MSRRSKTTELTRLVTTDELQLYKVLLDDTRDEILNTLADSQKGLTASELAKGFSLKLPTMMTHLRKLEQVGAIKKNERTGRHVNRGVVYYTPKVRVGKFNKQLDQIETAVTYFEGYLATAVNDFLHKHIDLVPSFKDPADLWEWLALLLKSTASTVPGLVMSEPQRLVAMPKLHMVATRMMALDLLNDILHVLLREAMKLAQSKNPKLAEIARKYGVRNLKQDTDALFLFDLVEDLMIGNDSKRLRAQVVLTELVEILPSSLSWKKDLEEVLPYVVKVGELLDPKSARSLYDFDFDSDESVESRTARWKGSARVLRDALQKPVLVAAK